MTEARKDLQISDRTEHEEKKFDDKIHSQNVRMSKSTSFPSEKFLVYQKTK